MAKAPKAAAATGQIGILGEQYVDGAPVLAEAFVRIKLG